MANETVDRCRRLLNWGSENPRAMWEGAAAFAVEGKRDSALVWMRNAIDEGWRDYRLALKDPVVASMSTDSTFQSLMAETRERVAAMRLRVAQVRY